MPAMTDLEMASLLDPDLNERPDSAGSDAQALRSQLMSNIEQNKLAVVANRISVKDTSRSASILEQPNGQEQGGDESDEASEAHDPAEDSLNLLDDEEESNAHGLQNSARSDAKIVTTEEPEDDVMRDPNGEYASEDDHDEDRNLSEPLGETDVMQIDHKEHSSNGKHAEESSDEEEEEAEFEDADSKIDADDDTVMLQLAKPISNEDTETESEAESEEADDMCVLCGQKDAEEATNKADLTCDVCRRPAHFACASAQNQAPDDTEHWRCSSCTEGRSSESPKETASKPRHSASRLVRDLLPVSRGVQKPGAHSIFAQPLIQDDDGGRSLRKRKSDADERGPRPDRPRKKLKETPQPDTVHDETITHATRRASQKLIPDLPPVKPARVLQYRPFHKPPPHKFILAFHLEQEKIAAILAVPSQPKRRKYLKKQKIQAAPPSQPPVPKFPALPTHHLIFPAAFGDRENEANAKPYGGILTEADAETSRSLPQMRDREIFEIARKEAEEERKKSTEKAEAEMNGLNDGAKGTNSKRTVSGPPSKIKCIQFGKHVIDTSYAAPYPEEYSHESRLFICEFCLKYLPSEFVAWRHKLKCPAKHPPGDEIYRDGSLSIWEVDGRKKTEYCQCLCLMAKLFLGSKTLYYDVDPFLFYILTEYDEYGYHFVGYFSKEKRPASQNNVSCILVMPIHQRKGYATFLIEFSYLLTRIEGKEGSPEKPLSDMGLTAYRSYWDLTLSRHLLELNDKPFSVKDIMSRTGMTADDVVHSLERLYAFVKDPVTKAYAIRYDRKLYETIVEKYDSKDFRKIVEDRLIWTPYIMGRSDAATLDAQPVQAIAQREETIVSFKEADEDDRISPKTTQEPPIEPEKEPIDPALLSAVGNIAPGPPSTEALNIPEPMDIEPSADAASVLEAVDKGKSASKSPVEVVQTLTGYALTYQVEKIPPTRFQIDPPIPPAMLRYAKSRRKSALGTPKANGRSKLDGGRPTTPQALRSSPRKAASTNGSTTGRTSGRSTPDRAGASASVRRSGRKSGLANEITTSTADESEDEDEEAVIDDEEDEEAKEQDGMGVRGKHRLAEDTIAVNSGDASSEEEEEEEEEEASQGSESGSEDEDEAEAEVDEEQDSASDDPDAEIDEEDDDSGSEEELEGEELEADGASAASSVAVSDGDGSDGSDED